MTDRELMQLALEALLEVNYDQAYAKEVAALRERLAQPEQEPDMTNFKPLIERLRDLENNMGSAIYEDAQTCGEAANVIEKLLGRLAQPVQEPVAWGVFDGPNLHDVNFTEEEAQEMMRLKGDGSVVKPLYTDTQPQMQPCVGRNCGSTNPNLHSAECFEDYEKATGMVREYVIDCPRCGHCCPQS